MASDSKFNSNLKGKLGTETITNFATIGDSSTALVGSTLTSSGLVYGGGTYIRVGANKILMFGDLSTEASIVTIATVGGTIATPLKGSIYSGRDGVWFFTGDAAASICLM